MYQKQVVPLHLIMQVCAIKYQQTQQESSHPEKTKASKSALPERAGTFYFQHPGNRAVTSNIMYNEYYSFGGLSLHLTGETPWQSSEICNPFRTDKVNADHTIHVTVSDDFPDMPENSEIGDGICRFNDDDGFYMLQKHGCGFQMLASRKNDVTNVILSSAYTGKISTRTILEASGIFDLLAEHEMLVLHSSYIVTKDGEGILFSGPSGIGKSTQAELWQKYASADTVNGDRALVRVNDGTVHGFMYSGTSGISKNVSAPIKAIILPTQSQFNKVCRPRPNEAFVRVLNQCSYYQWSSDSSKRMTDLVARLVNRVPIYSLECTKDEGAVRTLESALANNSI